MSSYRVASAVNKLVGIALLASGFALGVFEILTVAWAIGITVGALVIASLLLPNHRQIALRSLTAGSCPLCESPVRVYEHQRDRYYCRKCQTAFTDMGRKRTSDDDE